MNINTELLTIQELATRLKVPCSWLYSRTRERGENAIPLVKVGKYIRFNYEEVRQWLHEKQG